MFLSAYRASPTGWSILFLKLVLIFLCSLKPSHSTPSFFLFGIFGDKSTSPEAKQNRRNNGASLRHVFSHSGSLVTMSWRSPRNNRKYQLFARFYNEKTLTVPLTKIPKNIQKWESVIFSCVESPRFDPLKENTFPIIIRARVGSWLVRGLQ